MSVKAPWFRCFPGNFLLGTAGMRPILFRTYTRLLMGLYEAGGTLANDDQKLKGLLELRPQDVRHLIMELVGLGKISVVEGVIHNGRTDHELSRSSEMNEKSGSISHPFEVHSISTGASVNGEWKPRRGKKRNKNHARAGDHERAHAHPSIEAEADSNKALPSQAESLITNALASEVSSLRPATNGNVEGSADVGSLGLGGRSPPQPSEAEQEPEPPRHEPVITPTAALLRSKLVTEGKVDLTSLILGAMRQMPKEDDDAQT
jgi:hypothetical protein